MGHTYPGPGSISPAGIFGFLGALHAAQQAQNTTSSTTTLTLRSLTAGGFDDATAGRAVAFMAEFVFGSARNHLMALREGGHPQSPEIRAALEQLGDEEAPTVRRVAQIPLDPYGDPQFRFDVDVFVAGLERLLDSGTA